MKDKCPADSDKTISPKPAKYSPEDRMAKYRRKAKIERGLLWKRFGTVPSPIWEARCDIKSHVLTTFARGLKNERFLENNACWKKT